MVMLLLLNGCSNRPVPAPVINLYQGKSYQDFQENSYAGNSYKVKKGDTLFSIAWFSGNDYRDLARINKIEHPYNIYPGQKILLAKTLSSTTTSRTAHTGHTRKNKVSKVVDRPVKQGYGKSENIVNKKAADQVSKDTNKHKTKQAAKTGVNKFSQRVSAWRWPAKGKVIGTFANGQQGNKGVDIAGKRGTPVVAAASGKVVYTGDALRGYGKLVIIKHTDSFLSAYAHNDKILVQEQSWISAGQRIASMGDSGTDQVKLHFEVRYKGKSVDPLRYLPATQ